MLHTRMPLWNGMLRKFMLDPVPSMLLCLLRGGDRRQAAHDDLALDMALESTFTAKWNLALKFGGETFQNGVQCRFHSRFQCQSNFGVRIQNRRSNRRSIAKNGVQIGVQIEIWRSNRRSNLNMAFDTIFECQILALKILWVPDPPLGGPGAKGVTCHLFNKMPNSRSSQSATSIVKQCL